MKCNTSSVEKVNIPVRRVVKRRAKYFYHFVVSIHDWQERSVQGMVNVNRLDLVLDIYTAIH
jgi:hypothetical protein